MWRKDILFSSGLSSIDCALTCEKLMKVVGNMGNRSAWHTPPGPTEKIRFLPKDFCPKFHFFGFSQAGCARLGPFPPTVTHSPGPSKKFSYFLKMQFFK